MFYVTLVIYLGGVLLTAMSWGMVSFAIFRFITGLGIGGEYAAINSAIDELIPARLRGRIDLIVNGSYWIGAGIGAAATILLLNPGLLPVDLGWRLGFGIGGLLGLIILILRATCRRARAGSSPTGMKRPRGRWSAASKTPCEKKLTSILWVNPARRSQFTHANPSDSV
jgi:MFS family permease